MISLSKNQLPLISTACLCLIFLISQIIYLIAVAFFPKAPSSHTSILQNVPVSAPVSLHKNNPDVEANAENKAYIALADQYQYLQMEHKLLNEQIAVAKLRNELNELNAQNSSTANNSNKIPVANYQLVYLSQENQRWTATIANNNNYQSVQAGDQLDDGSKVMAIDQNGVTLLSGQQKLLLTFNDTKKIADLAAAISQTVSSKINDVQQTQNTLLAKKVEKTNQELNSLAQAEQRVYSGHLNSQTESPSNQNEPFTLDEILLLELPSKNYTIRVAQDGSLSDLKKLIAKFHLDPKAMLFHFKKNQQTEHVLIFGDFASKEQAEDALNKLPPSLLQLTPQIVTMSEVQQAIKVMH